jgi:hypothetical protein
MLKTLPKRLKMTMIQDDLKFAVCGSPTNCAGVHMVRRIFPKVTYVKINPNRATITCYGLIHRYGISNKMLKLAILNDDGTLRLNENETHDVTFKLIEVTPVKTAEQQIQNSESKKRMKALRQSLGIPETNPGGNHKNIRFLAAKAAGKTTKSRGKRLLGE